MPTHKVTPRARALDIAKFGDRVDEFNKMVGIAAARGDLEVSVELMEQLELGLRALRVTVEILGKYRTVERTTEPSSRPPSSASPRALVSRGLLDTVDAMVKNGLLVNPSNFQKLIGWSTRQAVWKAADSHRVFYLTYKAERYFPAFYADTAYERKHLEEVT